MVSLYHNTMTKDAFLQSRYGILQLMDQSQKDLIPLLGKKSGYERMDDDVGSCSNYYDKAMECSKLGYEWMESSSGSSPSLDSIKILPRCQSYIKLKVIKSMEGGDHELALCEVVGVGEWDDGRREVVEVAVGSSWPGL